jgi:hypothetical protein
VKRYYYSETIGDFLEADLNSILGTLTREHGFDLQQTQRDAWIAEISILKSALKGIDGVLVFEFSIPRMGSRIDAVLLIRDAVFVIEFKIGAGSFTSSAIDQVVDYALDLHYFHQPSHICRIVPVLVATDVTKLVPTRVSRRGLLFSCMGATPGDLRTRIDEVLEGEAGPTVDPVAWLSGRYDPTPTIVEAASALYRGHSVEEISRSDAGGVSLKETSDAVSRIIESASANRRKSICFVTGVPGAGKTLVGLNIANQHTDADEQLYSVFLSGNGPLVDILREALARDAVRQKRLRSERTSKKAEIQRVKQRIQNVHHFRDDCVRDPKAPIEHVALFDEAQRAWDIEQTTKFMARKRGVPDFGTSEPQFLISCLDRHPDWATVVCLVGGGQEINTGEGGIREWIEALRQFPDWHIHVSPDLSGAEFQPGERLAEYERQGRVTFDKALHLRASMRAFRAEAVSNLVQALLDFDREQAKAALAQCSPRYPIKITRSLGAAKSWLREQARGTERYGLIVSSAAERLRPHAIHVKAPINYVNWFLNDKDDVRSSYYLEDVATEFHVQGLELDWACVTWDADFRYTGTGWEHYNFVGSSWNRVRKQERQRYQLNAYRVLLTRARQGMVIVVPEGDEQDPTRSSKFYDPTFEYLRSIGFDEI